MVSSVVVLTTTSGPVSIGDWRRRARAPDVALRPGLTTVPGQSGQRTFQVGLSSDEERLS